MRHLSFIILLSSVLFCSCSIFRSTNLQISIESDKNANFGAPVQMDIVFITNPELQRVLLTMSSKEWFERREQFLKDNPNQDEVLSQYFEWIPGQNKTQQKVKGNGAQEAILFMNYGRSTATNRMKVLVGSHISIRLHEATYEVKEIE